MYRSKEDSRELIQNTEEAPHGAPFPAIQSPYIKPQLPMFYDLSSDPHEDHNLLYTDLTNAWMLGPAFKVIGEYERSVREYPNIKVGEDFKGYKK